MYSDDQLRAADWTPGEEKINQKIARAHAFILAASQGNTPELAPPVTDRWGDSQPATEPEFDDESALYWASLQPLDFNARVERIIAEAAYMDIDGLISAYHWDNDDGVVVTGETRDKMSIVKEEVLAQVAQRFSKYADADVGAVAFDTRAKDLHAYSLKSLQERIPTMDCGMGGGTNIAKAIFACLRMINKSPSATNNHHIVIVSDGLDNSVAGHATEIKQQFLDKGVTMDFIHITGLDKDTYGRNEVVSLKEISDDTGGEYVAVRTTDQFRTKFIAAATRLALPAPKGQ
jgi:hypothetical protein